MNEINTITTIAAEETTMTTDFLEEIRGITKDMEQLDAYNAADSINKNKERGSV